MPCPIYVAAQHEWPAISTSRVKQLFKQPGLYEAKCLMLQSILNMLIAWRAQRRYHSNMMNINLVMLVGALDKSISGIFLDRNQHVDGFIMMDPYCYPCGKSGESRLIHSFDAHIAEYSFAKYAAEHTRDYCIRCVQHCFRQIPKFVIQIPSFDEGTGNVLLGTRAIPDTDTCNRIVLPRHIDDVSSITEIVAPALLEWAQDIFDAKSSSKIMEMFQRRWGHEVGDETE